MKIRIISYICALSLVFLTPSVLAQTISAQIQENTTTGACARPAGSCTSCYSTFKFNIVWSRTAPPGYRWAPVMVGGYDGSSGFIVGQGGADQGSATIFSGSGNYASAPCNKWLGNQEQTVNAQKWTVWGQVTAPDGTSTVVHSNVAQVSNPSS